MQSKGGGMRKDTGTEDNPASQAARTMHRVHEAIFWGNGIEATAERPRVPGAKNRA